MAVVREIPRTTSSPSSSTIILNVYKLFAASQGAQQPPGPELSDPLAQLPHVHVLTVALSTLTGLSMFASFATDGRGSIV